MGTRRIEVSGCLVYVNCAVGDDKRGYERHEWVGGTLAARGHEF